MVGRREGDLQRRAGPQLLGPSGAVGEAIVVEAERLEAPQVGAERAAGRRPR